MLCLVLNVVLLTSTFLQGDLFFYICNNHTTFSTFLATPGDTYSRHGRRLTYLCVNCFTLFVVIVLKSVIPVSPTAKKLITIFCVSPTIILIRKSLYYLWACPCLDREAPEQSYMTRLLTSPGARTATLLTGAFYLGILLVGAMYTPGKVRELVALRMIIISRITSIYFVLFCDRDVPRVSPHGKSSCTATRSTSLLASRRR